MQKIIPALLLSALATGWLLLAATFSGKIMDKKGTPIANVELVFSNPDTTITTYTNDQGKYTTQLPKGTYRLVLQHPAYESRTITAIQIGMRNEKRNFTLNKGTIQVVKAEEALDEEVTLKTDDIKGNAIMPPPPPVEMSAPAPEYKAKEITQSAKMKRAPSASTAPRGTPATTLGYTISAPQPAPAYQYTWQKNPGEPVSTEQYNTIVENGFQQAETTPFSTFSIDVDAASYSNVRRFLNSGQKPPADAVRIEEMVNYFDYHYPQPTQNDPINIITELGQCPWNTQNHLLMVGLQGRDVPKEQIPPGNFVFLVDVSGSMSSANKLPLVKSSLELLLNELRPNDRVALVTYAGNTAVILESTPASEKEKIKAAINGLDAGGGTAGASGIQLAYQTARTNFKQQGNNRVILCTDGDFNVGVSSEQELVSLIEQERKSGVYLTVLGFGTGNYQDGKMQELADRGNGNHAYIDQLSEAKKVLVKEFGGTLYTIAKDVKLQLVFNPEQVLSYRLIGYENRMLAKEDFDNDAKDAGELGAGHTVTALYEIIPNPKGKTGDLLSLKFRYKPASGNQSSLLVERAVPAVCTAIPSENFHFAAAVAESGLLLRNSTHKGSANWDQVLARAQKGMGTDANGYRQEFISLVQKMK